MSANPTSSSSSIVSKSEEGMIIQSFEAWTCIVLPTLYPGQTDSTVPHNDWCIADYLRNSNGENFILYMDAIGWPQDGAFTTLLSTVGYYFNEKDGRIVIQKRSEWAASALSVLICEL